MEIREKNLAEGDPKTVEARQILEAIKLKIDDLPN